MKLKKRNDDPALDVGDMKLLSVIITPRGP